MRLLLTMVLAAVPLGAASAETAHGMGAALLPPACVAAARPAANDEPAMAGMAHGAGMAHAADAMMQMHDAMAEAATIADPDLAFNCGMIAHHRGAIDMAETELKEGKDAASRGLAEAIIAAQQREIAAMTAWVAQHAR